jgi:hypothetical protein
MEQLFDRQCLRPLASRQKDGISQNPIFPAIEIHDHLRRTCTKSAEHFSRVIARDVYSSLLVWRGVCCRWLGVFELPISVGLAGLGGMRWPSLVASSNRREADDTAVQRCS